MSLEGKHIGIAFTGSFCTFEKAFEELQNLVALGANVQTIFSFSAASLNSRFGMSKNFIKKAEEITKVKPILTIEGAEPIGPKSLLDILVLFPCTGNTLAKLAHGIADTSVTMAVKSHLRNGRPVVLAVSTNDALAVAAENIGKLLARKHIYFVPFGQDDAFQKPTSMISDFTKIAPAVDAALEGRQLQPILLEG